jgi:hypothetical protein
MNTVLKMLLHFFPEKKYIAGEKYSEPVDHAEKFLKKRGKLKIFNGISWFVL